MPQSPLSDPLTSVSAALAGLVRVARQSVVAVTGRRTAISGFLWRPGLVVTAVEGLGEGTDLSVTDAEGTSRQASLVGGDASTDVALLRVADLAGAPVRWAGSSPDPGALALAPGAMGGDALAASGIVARSGAVWQSMRGGRIDARIELDLRLRRAMEGGLAIGPDGAAFGMAVFGPRRTALVIPAATVERVAGHLLQYGRVVRGYLGLGLQPVAVPGREGAAAMVMSVDPGWPGDGAGILQGDIITGLDGAPMGSVRHLVRSLGPDSVGRVITFTLRRAGEERDVTLTVGERPAA